MMSFDVLGELNWLAVLVGAVIYFALGALWYSPMLFARPWQRSIGWDPERTPPQQSVTTYIVPFLAYVAMAIAVGMLAKALGSDSAGEGIVLGLVLGIGLSLMHTLVDATFDPNKPEPWLWFAINGTYHAIGLILVAVIVSVWV
jgi:uncharacterized membrane protein YeaQ/YmgE (transglycosylase-associated protein family)